MNRHAGSPIQRGLLVTSATTTWRKTALYVSPWTTTAGRFLPRVPARCGTRARTTSPLWNITTRRPLWPYHRPAWHRLLRPTDPTPRPSTDYHHKERR